MLNYTLASRLFVLGSASLDNTLWDPSEVLWDPFQSLLPNFKSQKPIFPFGWHAVCMDVFVTVESRKIGFNKSKFTGKIACPVLIRTIFKCVSSYSETTASPGNQALHSCFVIRVGFILLPCSRSPDDCQHVLDSHVTRNTVSGHRRGIPLRSRKR